MDNIKESKEYQLAKDWERAVNDYGFNPKRFAAAIPEMHPRGHGRRDTQLR